MLGYWIVFCQLVVNGFSKYLTIYTVLQHYTTEETCLSTFQSPIDPSTILGGFPGNNFTEVVSSTRLCWKHFHGFILLMHHFLSISHCCQASAFVITYPVNNKVETTGQENGKAVAWERAYVNLVKVSNFSQFISLYLC